MHTEDSPATMLLEVKEEPLDMEAIISTVTTTIMDITPTATTAPLATTMLQAPTPSPLKTT